MLKTRAAAIGHPC